MPHPSISHAVQSKEVSSRDSAHLVARTTFGLAEEVSHKHGHSSRYTLPAGTCPPASMESPFISNNDSHSDVEASFSNEEEDDEAYVPPTPSELEGKTYALDEQTAVVQEGGMSSAEWEDLIEETLIETNCPERLCDMFTAYKEQVVLESATLSKEAVEQCDKLNAVIESLNNELLQVAENSVQTSSNLDSTTKQGYKSQTDGEVRRQLSEQRERLESAFASRLQEQELSFRTVVRENDAAWDKRFLEETQTARERDQITHKKQIAELKALHHEVTTHLLKDLEKQRSKTRQAEIRLEEFKRECSSRGTVIYPLLEMYEQVSQLTDMVLEAAAKN